MSSTRRLRAAAGRLQTDYRVSMLNAQAMTYLPARLVERTRTRRNGIVGLRLRRLATDEQSRRLVESLDEAFHGGEIVTGEEVSFSHDDSSDDGKTWWNGWSSTPRSGRENQ